MLRDAKNAVKIAINYRGQRELLVREYFFTFARRFTPVVAVDSGDLRFHVSTSTEEDRLMFGARGLDEEAMAELVRVLGEHTGVAEPLKDRVVLDVGGNIGTSSIYAVRRYGAKGAIAFEPAPANLRLLRLNLLENDVADAVNVIAAALSDVDGEVTLELSPENSGDHRVRTADAGAAPGLIGEERREVVTVQSRRLDTLVAEGQVDLADVGLIWMDVQGHEGHVLNGAHETMKQGIPVVLEYWAYGLERAGGRELLHKIIAENFSRIVDMGPPWSQEPPTVLAAADVAQLAGRYTSHDVFADLLLLP
ncbi:MAG: FkbM family methyltransferase [Solirubrobacterales bacterium]|nr:FkbM family methyltransferase [Solirubrobacterales bacterium]